MNNRLVKLPYFVLLQSLEAQMVDEAGNLITENILTEVLDPARFEQIRGKMERQRRNRANLNWVSLLSFDKIVRCACHLGKVSLDPAQVQVLSQVRNSVCHEGRMLVGRHSHAKRLAQVKTPCMGMLANRAV